MLTPEIKSLQKEVNLYSLHRLDTTYTLLSGGYLRLTTAHHDDLAILTRTHTFVSTSGTFPLF
jgi:hypothetical protein